MLSPMAGICRDSRVLTSSFPGTQVGQQHIGLALGIARERQGWPGRSGLP